MNWHAALYMAVTVLGWSHAEFWLSSPAQFDEQVRQHRRAHSRVKRGNAKPEPTKVRYIDQIPKGLW